MAVGVVVMGTGRGGGGCGVRGGVSGGPNQSYRHTYDWNRGLGRSVVCVICRQCRRLD